MDAAGYDLPEGRRVDMPPRACSRSYYPNLTALYDAAKVTLAPFSWAFCYTDASDESGKPYFRVDGGSTTNRSSTIFGFRLPSMNLYRLLTFSNLKLGFDAVRFHVAIRRDVRDPFWETKTFGEYLDQGGYSESFVLGGLLPMLSMVCTCSYENVRLYPAAVIMRYLAVSSSHEQFRTKHGTQNAAETLGSAAETLMLGTRVIRVLPRDLSKGRKCPVVLYETKTRTRSGKTKIVQAEFDQVVVAAPANIAAKMLSNDEDKMSSELSDVVSALQSVEHEMSRVVLHRNPVVMPKDKKDWAAMAMVCETRPEKQGEHKGERQSESSRVMFTMYASHDDVLALDESKYGPLFMTWNPFNRFLPPPQETQVYPGVAVHHEVDAKRVARDEHKIMSNVRFERPLVTLSTKRATDTFWKHQGHDGIWIVGAYTLFEVPLQENAVASSVAVAQRMGVNIPFRPANRAASVTKSPFFEDNNGRNETDSGESTMLALLLSVLFAYVCNMFTPWTHVPSSHNDLLQNGNLKDVFRQGFEALTSSGETYGLVLAYFAALLLGVTTSLISWPWRKSLSSRPSHLIVVACSLLAWLVTWRLIFAFFIEFANRYSNDQESPNMFVEAYAMVTDNFKGWIWSSQLLLWVVPGIIFLYVESKRRSISSTLAMAWISSAFLGAVSLGFPLAFSHLNLSSCSFQKNVSGLELFMLVIVSVCALWSVHVMPISLMESRRDEFTFALIVLHLILVVPFLLRGLVGMGKNNNNNNNSVTEKLPSLALTLSDFNSRFGPGVLFFLVGIACFTLHKINLNRAQDPDVWNLIFTDHEPWRNSCQSSIDFDVLFTSLLTALLMVFEMRGSGAFGLRTLISLVFTCLVMYYAVPTISLGAVFSFYCVVREFLLV